MSLTGKVGVEVGAPVSIGYAPTQLKSYAPMLSMGSLGGCCQQLGQQALGVRDAYLISASLIGVGVANGLSLLPHSIGEGLAGMCLIPLALAARSVVAPPG